MKAAIAHLNAKHSGEAFEDVFILPTREWPAVEHIQPIAPEKAASILEAFIANGGKHPRAKRESRRALAHWKRFGPERTARV